MPSVEAVLKRARNYASTQVAYFKAITLTFFQPTLQDGAFVW